jgi:glycosyltransferase involved in cell wall biosynthesis
VKAYVKAPEQLSRAMYRVANALERYALDDVFIVQEPAEADLLVLHVIGREALELASKLGRRYAVIQYCTGGGADLAAWRPLWARAKLTWSYYDLAAHMPAGAEFYRAPMGLDPIFRQSILPWPPGRDVGVLTSGYVNGRGQESIEEPTRAAQALGLEAVHLGPRPDGVSDDLTMRCYYKLADTELRKLYHRCRWIAALRYVEGFEMPAAEGLACGARPIVFDRADMRDWYQDHAVFVPECSGEMLTARLKRIMSKPPRPVTPEERAVVLERFNWKTIIAGFWQRIKEGR